MSNPERGELIKDGAEPAEVERETIELSVKEKAELQQFVDLFGWLKKESERINALPEGEKKRDAYEAAQKMYPSNKFARWLEGHDITSSFSDPSESAADFHARALRARHRRAAATMAGLNVY